MYREQIITFVLFWFALGGMMVFAALLYRILTLSADDDDSGFNDDMFWLEGDG